MNQEKFKKASEKISEIVRLAEQRVAIRYINDDVADCYGKLLLKYARELVAAVDENEPQISEMSCNCNCAKQTKTLQEIIDNAKSQLTDNQTYAAIVFRV